VKVTVNVFESIELGVHLKKEDGIKPILDYIDSQLTAYMEEMEAPKRNLNIKDPRIHACIYFLAPRGHPMNDLDVTLISKIHKKVNLIPVIAKADSFTPEECKKYKELIMKTLEEQHTQLYPLSYIDTRIPNYPFALIGSEGEYEVAGKKVRGRKYKWGIAQVDNAEHCDFLQLKNLLIGDNFLDMLEKTELIYEEFRREHLTSKGVQDVLMESDDDFQEKVEKLEREKAEFAANMKKQEEAIKKQYDQKNQESDATYKKKEEELTKRRELLDAELEELKKRVTKEEEEIEAMGESNEDGDEKEEKKKKRKSLLLTKSLRRK